MTYFVFGHSAIAGNLSPTSLNFIDRGNHTLTLNTIPTITLSLSLNLTINLTLILTLQIKIGWVQTDILPNCSPTESGEPFSSQMHWLRLCSEYCGCSVCWFQNKILWVDEKNMTMHAESGIIGQDLERRVRNRAFTGLYRALHGFTWLCVALCGLYRASCGLYRA